MFRKMRSVVRYFVDSETESKIRQSFYRLLPVQQRSIASNIFHCCTHKTASQWFRVVLSDPLIYRYSGMTPDRMMGSYYYTNEDINCSLSKPIKNNTIVTCFYIHYDNFAKLQKTNDYYAFFIIRDPRDLVVSAYFSYRQTHQAINMTREIQLLREKLQKIDVEDGLILTINHLKNRAFATTFSWLNAVENPRIKLFKFEDIMGSRQIEYFHDLLLHCNICLPSISLEKLLHRYRFERFSGGRKKGEEDRTSKYRSGIPGGWKKYFNKAVSDHFYSITGDLVSALDYE